MNNELKSNFDAYVEEFKKIPLEEKKDKVIESIQELLGAMQSEAEDLGIEYTDLLNKEIIDIKKENRTEDDYVEAVFVYIESIKEVYSKVMLEIIEKVGSES